MGQALYRKYRSKTLAEVVGQDHVVQTLAAALKSGRVRHAYLFSGPRGVGKTSVARILAHEVNNLAYKDGAVHLDIIEIDAASNRRIDEIRELRERVHAAPAAAKFKVYIIDEVHMLTKEAFNALLKTLEEPPEHCIFILATTEAHKLPETIISRTQHFTFKPVANAAAVKKMRAIAKSEKINIEPEALELLAEFSEGSFRDSLTMLDQLAAFGRKVSRQDAEAALGLPAAEAIVQLADCLRRHDSQALLAILEQLYERGSDPAVIAKLLAKHLRREIIGGGGPSHTGLLKQLLDVPSSLDPRQLLEIILLEAAQAYPSAAGSQSAGAVDAVTSEKPMPAPGKSSQDLLAAWPQLLDRTRQSKPSLYTALRLAKPRLNEGILTLTFEFPLHQKKVNTSEHLEFVSQLAREISGASPPIRCVIEKAGGPKKPAPAQKNKPAIDTISNIFGSTEVLESES